MGDIQFSAKHRQDMLEEMARKSLDVLVIGGGITGCGIALDAANRGMRVGLLDMQDFGAGTSSRSTKLIHGGLRYLKQLELRLVKEVGRERAVLYHNAPHIVYPEPMLLPLIKGGTYGKLSTSIGLWVYDRLAGVKRRERRRMLTVQETLEKEPLLARDRLKGSGYYVEYRTDDARLTLEVVKTAVSQGALACNYAQVTELLYEAGLCIGAKVEDKISGKGYSILANKVVNAAGPWGDDIRQLDQSLKGKRLHITKGVHLVVDQKRFPLQQATYFDVEDGRMIFAIPRANKTYIGTTDTNYAGDYREPHMTDQDRDYLIAACNAMFPSVQLTSADIESFWVGLRPLIHVEGKSPSELSRKDEVILSKSNLITIAGGKLTGYRRMAERVVNLVAKQLEKEQKRIFSPCQTDQQVLSGGEVEGPQYWPRFRKNRINLLIEHGLNPQYAEQAVKRYGTNIGKVLEYKEEALSLSKRYGLPWFTVAEALYSRRFEMTVTADDFLTRRISAKYFDAPFYKQYKPAVEQLFKSFTQQEEEHLQYKLSSRATT